VAGAASQKRHLNQTALSHSGHRRHGRFRLAARAIIFGGMRTVGTEPSPRFGPRGPTQSEIDASIDSSRQASRSVPKGVYRYKSHADANAAMDRWTVNGMVEKARELGGPSY
jgi:hypothetical protein